MALPESPGTTDEDEVVCAGEVANILCRWVYGQLDHVGAFDELCACKVVVLGVSRKCAVVEDEESEEAGEPVEGPHGYTGPDPGMVHPCRGEFQVAIEWLLVTCQSCGFKLEGG